MAHTSGQAREPAGSRPALFAEKDRRASQGQPAAILHSTSEGAGVVEAFAAFEASMRDMPLCADLGDAAVYALVRDCQVEIFTPHQVFNGLARSRAPLHRCTVASAPRCSRQSCASLPLRDGLGAGGVQQRRS